MPLHVSNITCSFSGGATQTALGTLRACYARSIPSAACGAPSEDEQVMLETCRGINS
jgi:hypothetical protein